MRPFTSIVHAPQTSSRQLQSQATGVVLLAVVRGGLGGDLLQHADDVQIRLVGNLVPLPTRRLAGSVLAEDADRRERGVMAVGGHHVIEFSEWNGWN